MVNKMETNCIECGNRLIVASAQLVNAEDNVYQTVLACTACGSKMEVGRVLNITQVNKFNPVSGKIISEDNVEIVKEEALVKF